MAFSVKCVVGAISNGLPLPHLPLALEGLTIEAIFAEASGTDISLTLDTQALATPFPAPAGSEGIGSLDVHRAIASLTRNSANTQRVSTIALVFASKFQPRHDAFGIMLDYGRSHPFDLTPSPDHTSVPREGCAVFLDAIRASRGNGEEFQRQAVFTAIHELAHVFNLQHRLPPPLSFMAQSRPQGAYRADEDAFRFLDPDRSLLSLCSSSEHIWPGGSHFTDLGPLRGADGPFAFSEGTLLPELRIAVRPAEFWYFEPIELDIELILPAGMPGPLDIPDTMDPGYESLVIWLELPNGERKRFKSPRHYCWSGATHPMAPGERFRRDISLNIDARGYVFGQAGHHRIWVDFQISPDLAIRSNTLDVLVRPVDPSNPLYVDLAAALARPASAKLLYYRRLSRSRMEEKRLLELVRKYPRTSIAGAIHYALGRAHLAFSSSASSRSRCRACSHSARDHLLKAAACKPLSDHRREKAFLLGQQLTDTLKRAAAAGSSTATPGPGPAHADGSSPGIAG